MSTWAKIKALFKDPPNAASLRQPIWPRINMEDIPPASALLFYNGNRLTERAGVEWFGHKYWPPAFHAAVYIEDGRFLNVGKFRTVEELARQLRSNRRVDVAIFRNLDSVGRKSIVNAAYFDLSQNHVGFELPDYAMMDYLRFLFRGMKPSKKDFCSENVAELLGRANWKTCKDVFGWRQAVAAARGVLVSDGLPCDTAPWDIQEWAEANKPPDATAPGIELRTLHIGDDYPF